MGTEGHGQPGETDKQHSVVELLELPELVGQLERLEEKHTENGHLERRDAVVRAAVERRILELVAGPAPDVERREQLRVPCQVEISIVAKGKTHPATATDVGPGGVFVATSADLGAGDGVEIHVPTNTGERPLRVSGNVAWVSKGDPAGVGVAFHPLERDARVRRLWRLILRLLHARI